MRMRQHKKKKEKNIRYLSLDLSKRKQQQQHFSVGLKHKETYETHFYYLWDKQSLAICGERIIRKWYDGLRHVARCVTTHTHIVLFLFSAFVNNFRCMPISNFIQLTKKPIHTHTSEMKRLYSIEIRYFVLTRKRNANKNKVETNGRIIERKKPTFILINPMGSKCKQKRSWE